MAGGLSQRCLHMRTEHQQGVNRRHAVQCAQKQCQVRRASWEVQESICTCKLSAAVSATLAGHGAYLPMALTPNKRMAHLVFSKRTCSFVISL